MCFSGDSDGDRGLSGPAWEPDSDSLVGEEEGVEARRVDGDLPSSESGRRNGEARGELKDSGLVGEVDYTVVSGRHYLVKCSGIHSTIVIVWRLSHATRLNRRSGSTAGEGQ